MTSRPQRAATVSVRARIGVNTHFYMGSAQGNPSTQLHFLHANGVAFVREPFKWNQIQPTPTAWNWRVSDDFMTAASRAHVSVLGVLAFSAPWASSDPTGRGRQTFPPRDPADYARFAAAVVARYGPTGSFWRAHPELPTRSLVAVEIWNEPWGHSFWQPDPSPAAYLQLARLAAEQVHRTDRSVKVLIAGDLIEARSDHAFADWFATLVKLDPSLSKWADALSVHPYPNPGVNGPLDEHLDPRLRFSRLALIDQIQRMHAMRLPIWVTEIGWRTGHNRTVQVDEVAQARYLSEAVQGAIGEYRVAYVFVTSWDVDTGADDQQYGLRRTDGTLKPAWTALHQLLAAG